MEEDVLVGETAGVDRSIAAVVVTFKDVLLHGAVGVDVADELHGEDDVDKVEQEVHHQPIKIHDRLQE